VCFQCCIARELASASTEQKGKVEDEAEAEAPDVAAAAGGSSVPLPSRGAASKYDFVKV